MASVRPEGAPEVLPAVRRRGWPAAWTGPAATAVLAVILLLVPLVSSQYLDVVGFEMFTMGALAQAWNLVGGYGGLISLGSAAFVGVGSYAVAEATTAWNVPVLPALALAALMAAAFAALLSVPMLRMRGIYFAIGTLAVTEASGIAMLNWDGLGGSAGIFLNNVTPPSPVALYYIGLGLLLLFLVVAWVLMRSVFGLRLRSIRDNEDVAQEMGVPTFWTKFWAFVISSAMMGVIGGVEAIYLGAIDPTGAFALRWTIDTVNIAIIGGSSTLAGPLVGTLFIEGLGQVLANYPEVHLAISGAILIAVIRFAPSGIWGALAGGWRRAGERVRRNA
jgi:branched-chain amino acid transport system permease protein